MEVIYSVAFGFDALWRFGVTQKFICRVYNDYEQNKRLL